MITLIATAPILALIAQADRTLAGRPGPETTRGEMLQRGWLEMKSISVYYEREPGQPSTSSGITFRDDLPIIALPKSLWSKFEYGTCFELWANGRVCQGYYYDHCPHNSAWDVSKYIMTKLVNSKDPKVYDTRLNERTHYRVYWRVVKDAPKMKK